MTRSFDSMYRPSPTPFHVATPLPPGMEVPFDVQRPAQAHNPQPMQNHIRGLIQRLRGQIPTPADTPAPAPPQSPPMRSVLKGQ